MIKSPAEYEAEFKRKYSRWSADAWHTLTKAAVPTLLRNQTGLSEAESERILHAYLTLCAEAIGGGHLSPGAANLYELLLLKHIPAQLGLLGGATAQLAKLADIFNLCESADAQEAWVSPLLMKLLTPLKSLEDLDRSVDGLAGLLNSTGAEFDPANSQVHMYRTDHLGFYLPRKLKFVAPPLLEVWGERPEGAAKVSVYLPEKTGLLAVETLNSNDLGDTSAADSRAPLLLKHLPFELTLQDCAWGTMGAALIFRESQNIWVWTRGTT